MDKKSHCEQNHDQVFSHKKNTGFEVACCCEQPKTEPNCSNSSDLRLLYLISSIIQSTGTPLLRRFLIGRISN